jgi:hypothetical protein
MASTGTGQGAATQNSARKSAPKVKQGLPSLTAAEKEILTWNTQRRLAEFQKVNVTVDTRALETKLLYIDTITIDNGEVLDILRLNPTLSWEKVRDVFMGGAVDGYTSTFHGLEDITYPEYFWKAIIENEREKLSAA